MTRSVSVVVCFGYSRRPSRTFFHGVESGFYTGFTVTYIFLATVSFFRTFHIVAFSFVAVKGVSVAGFEPAR